MLHYQYTGTFGAVEEWEIGQPKPDEPDFADDGSVVYVTANGAELERIREQFRNLPDVPHRQEVTWTGDFAAFILANL